MSSARVGLIFAFITTSIWAFQALILKYVVQHLDPYTIVWARFLFSFIFVFIYLYIKDRKAIKILFKPPFIFLLAGLALAINYYGFLVGIQKTGPGNAQVVIQLGPVLLALSGVVYFKEKLTRLNVMGFLVATAGEYVFFQDQISQTLDHADQYLSGNLWIVLAAVLWAFYSLIVKKFTHQFSAMQINLIVYALSSVLMFPQAKIDSLTSLSFWPTLMMIVLSFCTIFAYGFLAEALQKSPANQVSIIITLNPFMTMALIQLLKTMNIQWIPLENLTWTSVVGAGLVLLGTTLAIYKKKKKAEV